MTKQVSFHPTAGSLRKASDASSFPYTWKTAPFIYVSTDGRINTAQSPADKMSMLQEKEPNDIILSVWPGDWRSDVFEIDDIDLAIKALRPAVPRDRFHVAAPDNKRLSP